MANPVVHFEIMGPDGPTLRKFYADLFDWQVDEMPGPMDYGTVAAPEDGPGIGGGIGKTPGDLSNLVTVYVAVDDPQAYLDKAEKMGAKTVQPVTEIPGVVTFAQFRDTQGNVVGLVKSEG